MTAAGQYPLPSSLAVLGSTGTVGMQGLDVARKKGIPVCLLAAHSNIKRLEEQIREFRPRFCSVFDRAAGEALRIAVKDTETEILIGESGLLYAIEACDASVYLNAILGEAGLLPTLAVLKTGKRLALSNKESLVIAGDIVNEYLMRYGSEMIPVDSEHSAIFQSLKSGRNEEIKKIILTASGGPFYGYSKDRLSRVTLADTLKHPTWKMGAKITVDSATMMNKGFEVIEAIHLFHVRPEQVQVTVHKESIIHSAIEYIDNTVIAELSVPDMRACVQYALTYPARTAAVIEPLDLFSVKSLSFLPPDTENFPLLPLAASTIADGGAVPATLNAADEIAVAAFLQEKISFCRISDIVTDTVETLRGQARNAVSLDEILSFDREARQIAASRISR